MNPTPSDSSTPAPPATSARWLDAYPWATFVLPFVVFMLMNMLEPTADKPVELGPLSIPYSAYPLVYSLKIALTMAVIAAVWPGYRQFPFRVTLLAPLVGAVGVVLWIGICKLELEQRLLAPLGLAEWLGLGQRSAFNPLEHFADRPLLGYAFLAVRFWGLVVIVPLIEEFFLRGLVMRYFIEPDWWKVPFGKLTPAAVAVGTLVPMALHPAELFAAAVWFSLITWLMWKTKSIWDCVVAHAVTNLLLGIYVVASGDWYFW